MSGWREAKYIEPAGEGPYIKHARTYWKTPKEDWKEEVKAISDWVDTGATQTLLDVACATGGFLYYLRKNFPHWKFSGIDLFRPYIETARSLSELNGIVFNAIDWRDLNVSVDIITCSGSAQIFPDIEEFLEKLIACTNQGGYLFIDGLFNEYDCDVVIAFRDLTLDANHHEWLRDFNIHSQRRIAEFLKGRVEKFEFRPILFNIDLPQDLTKPHTHIWTERMADGRRMLTNGLKVITNKEVLCIKK